MNIEGQIQATLLKMLGEQQRNLMTIADVAEYLQLTEDFVSRNKDMFPFFFSVTGKSKGVRARFESVQKWALEEEKNQNINIIKKNRKRKIQLLA